MRLTFSLIRTTFIALFAACVGARALTAQQTLGPGENAWTLPSGAIRFGLSSRFFGASERFGPGGTRQSLGAPYAGTLDATVLPNLRSLQDAFGTLTGNSSFQASIGVARTNFQQSGAIIPLELGVGISRRLTARVVVPFFTGQQEVQWLLDGSSGTIGANPQLASSSPLGPNSALVSGFSTAATSLEMLADGCAMDAASDPRCTQIMSQLSAVRSLILDARSFSATIASTYGGSTVAPSPFVPYAGSDAQAAVAARVEALRAAFEQYNTTSVGAGTAPVGAAAPATGTELERLLADSAYGYALGPLKRRYHQSVGDIDVTITALLFDGLATSDPWLRDSTGKRGIRQSVALTYRAGTGTPPNADDPIRMPSGTGESATELTSLTDIVATRHFWGTVVARWTKQSAFDGITRIPDETGSPFIPFSRRRVARTEPGSRVQFAVLPRWVLNQYFGAGVTWRYTREGGTKINELAPFTDAIPLSYTAPDASAHEVGIGFSWSSMAAWRRGSKKWPIDVEYERSTVISGSGNVPKLTFDRLSIRAYAKLWGR